MPAPGFPTAWTCRASTWPRISVAWPPCPCSEPGRAWGYSLATDVLGALVARVDGRPLASAAAAGRDSSRHARQRLLCADAQRLAAVYVSDRPRPRRMAERETVTPFEDCVGIRFEPRRAFEPSAASGGRG